MLQCVAMSLRNTHRVLQRVAIYFSVLQCVAVCFHITRTVRSVQITLNCSCQVLQCVAVCCSGLQWAAVGCSGLQCVAMCCSNVLQRVAVLLSCVGP